MCFSEIKEFNNEDVRQEWSRSSRPELFYKKVLSEISQNSQKNTCARVSEPEAWNFIKKETLAQLFSCEFCEISRNTFFTKHFRVTSAGLNPLMSGVHYTIIRT